jgi:hypothetical protein
VDAQHFSPMHPGNKSFCVSVSSVDVERCAAHCASVVSISIFCSHTLIKEKIGPDAWHAALDTDALNAFYCGTSIRKFSSSTWFAIFFFWFAIFAWVLWCYVDSRIVQMWAFRFIINQKPVLDPINLIPFCRSGRIEWYIICNGLVTKLKSFKPKT